MSSTSPQIMVVTSDGGFFVFQIDMENGGEGHLVKQFSYVYPRVSLPSLHANAPLSVLEGDDKLEASSYGP